MGWGTHDYVINIAHTICSVGTFVVMIMIMSRTIITDSNKLQYHLTETYLQDYSSNNPYGTFSPVSKPTTETDIGNNHYQCLMQAEVGIGPLYGCQSGSLASYVTCLNNQAAPTVRQSITMVARIRQILGDYRGDFLDLTQLPVELSCKSVALGNPCADLQVILADQSKRTALKSQLALLATPLAYDILQAITQSEKAVSMQSCMAASISNNANMNQNGVLVNLDVDLNSIFQYMWICASDLIYTEPVQKAAYTQCVSQTAWPIKDVMQTQYSNTLLGAYNKYFLAVLAFWILLSFQLYTHWGFASAATPNGKPKEFGARAGKFLVSFGCLWNLGGLIMVAVKSFQPADYWPMSIQTVFISFFFIITVSIYFAREVYELFFLAYEKGYFKMPMFAQFPPTPGGTRQLTGYMRVGSNDVNILEPVQYLPLIAPVWSDMFFFVDGMLFLAVVGLQTDVITVDIVICVFSLLMVSLINSALIRLIYEGYICEVPEGKTFYNENTFRTLTTKELKADEERPLHAVRVMVVLCNIIALLLQAVLLFITIKRFGMTSLVTFFIFFGSFLPQIVWLLITWLLEFQYIHKVPAIYSAISFVFIWNNLLRIAYGFVIFFYIDMEFNRNSNDEDSLVNLFKMIGTEGRRIASASANMR